MTIGFFESDRGRDSAKGIQSCAMLNSDLWRGIFSYLPTKSMVLQQKVCVLWNTIPFPDIFAVSESDSKEVGSSTTKLQDFHFFIYVSARKFRMVRHLRLDNVGISSAAFKMLADAETSLHSMHSSGRTIQRASLQEIVRMPIRILKLNFADIGNTDLACLSGISLTSLSLSQNRVSLLNLSSLARMPLTDLDLGGCRLNDDSLRSLVGMPLERLKLYPDFDDYTPGGPENPHITGTGLAYLSGMPLRYLSLRFLAISAARLMALQGLALTYLDLFNNSMISDEGLKCLVGMPLTYLDLGNSWGNTSSKIKGNGLKCLSAMPLKKLNLGWTSIEDGCLVHLMEIQLNFLNIKHTKVTADGCKRLKEKNPSLSLDVGDTFSKWG